jgi:hypothetical protein
VHKEGLEVVVGFKLFVGDNVGYGLTVGYGFKVPYSSNQIPALLKFVSFTDGSPSSSRVSSKLAHPMLLL